MSEILKSQAGSAPGSKYSKTGRICPVGFVSKDWSPGAYGVLLKQPKLDAPYMQSSQTPHRFALGHLPKLPRCDYLLWTNCSLSPCDLFVNTDIGCQFDLL